MFDVTTVALVLYALGVGLGIVLTDASWPVRIGLAVLWPVGPVAFVAVVVALISIVAVTRPLIGGAMIVLMAAIYAFVGWR